MSLRVENIWSFGISLGTKNELFGASHNRSSLANERRKKEPWRGKNLLRDFPLGSLNRIPILKDPSRQLFVYVKVVGGDEFDGGCMILAFQDRPLQYTHKFNGDLDIK